MRRAANLLGVMGVCGLVVGGLMPVDWLWLLSLAVLLAAGWKGSRWWLVLPAMAGLFGVYVAVREYLS